MTPQLIASILMKDRGNSNTAIKSRIHQSISKIHPKRSLLKDFMVEKKKLSFEMNDQEEASRKYLCHLELENSYRVGSKCSKDSKDRKDRKGSKDG